MVPEVEASTYGDVYNYGILLLEMFTGKRPTDGFSKEGLSLHNYVKMTLLDHVMEVVDPIILREAVEASANAPSRMNRLLECLTSVMEVGIACSLESPREKMDIRNAASELNGIRSILLRTRRTS